MKSKRLIYALLFLLLLATEVCIALFVHDGFVRPYLGDVLVTVLICAFMRMFIPKGVRLLPLYVFLFAVAVEIGQYFEMVKLLGLENSPFFSVLLGTAFSVYDILCYAVGCAMFVGIDWLIISNRFFCINQNLTVIFTYAIIRKIMNGGKEMAKRILALLLTAVTVFGLFACSKKPAEPATTATTATVQTIAPTDEATVTTPSETEQPEAFTTVAATVATIAPTTAATAAPTTAPTTATEPAATRKALAPLLELRGELPALKSREEMLDTLQKEVYGYLPAAPTNIEFTSNDITPLDYCNGKAELYALVAKCTVNGQEFSFPFRMVMPKNATEKVPFFLFIGFYKGNSKYQATEAVIDKGYAIIYYDYRDIASDDGKFDNGLSTILYPDGKRGDTDPGKIAMWAWGAHRMMDYAERINDKLDLSRAAVCGHSRTGKAALLAGATDTRIQFTYSNESGCAGSAISRRKAGESIARITSTFPYWFCKNYKHWAGREAEMPFDQHWLLASIAPRKVLVGSASKDINADPLSEQLGCLAASPAFQNGFDCDVMAVAGDAFLEGDIGYHMREGSHTFTETDWLRAVEFIDYHTGK